jgi:hypothetical protein
MSTSRKFDQCDHIGLDVVCDFRIDLQFCRRSRARQRFAVCFKVFRIQFQSLWSRASGALRSASSMSSPPDVQPGKSGNHTSTACVRSCILNDGDVVCHGEPQSGFLYPSRSRRRMMSRLVVNMKRLPSNHTMEGLYRLARVKRGRPTPAPQNYRPPFSRRLSRTRW